MTGLVLVNNNKTMPSKNRVKTYIENGYYHVYNRGVEKRNIFIDDQDYHVFLNFIKNYLLPPSTSEVVTHPLQEVIGLVPVRARPLRNFAEEITLLAYCLMPNHFHLLLHQVNKDSMRGFIQSLCTSYSMYFNKKYKRVGPLFQDVYKAALIMEEPYLLHLSRYIHLNPLESITGPSPVNIEKYSYSSYPYYLGKKKAEWIDPQPILAFFKGRQRINLRDCLSYQGFVEDYLEDSKEILGRLVLD